MGIVLEHVRHIALPAEVFNHGELHVVDVNAFRPTKKQDDPQ